MSLKKSLLTLTALGCLGYAGPALAQTCATNADCSPGFTCQVSGVVSTTKPACPPDMDCGKSGAGGDSGSSGTTTLSTCQPSPCATDDDCGAGMLCASHDVTTCSGGAKTTPCRAGETCDTSTVETDPTVCTTQTSSMCAYRWQLPCNADADCGDGFVCNPSVSGSCSGGTPVSGGAAGGETGGTVILSGPTDTCTTTTSYPGSCQVAVPTCLVDSDCPANWRCASYADPGATGIGADAGSGAGGSAVSKRADALISTTTPGMCTSPYSPPVAVKNGGAAGAGGATDAAGGSVGTSAPSTSGSGGATGTTAGTGSGGQPQLGGPSKVSTGADSSGCSVGPGAAGARSGLAVVALLGLGLIARRRRR